jgi:hypothetical protein
VLRSAILVMLSVIAPAPASQDSLRLASRDARSAAFAYERLLFSTAPEQFGGGYGGQCDERIGRFCFRFGSPGTPRRPPDPEPAQVQAARTDAIRAHRRWFAFAPDERRAAGPLIRYLIESDRAGEAVAAARTHVWATDGTAESLLFLGLALHYARDFAAAESAFDNARTLSTERERRRLDDISLLLETGEHSRYRGLRDDERVRYEARFWAFSDPWLMEPGNERRSAHYARHAWSRILAEAPQVAGRMRWGSDHHEIVVRYGRTTSRRRVREGYPTMQRTASLVEWFDPGRIALSPEALTTEGIPYTPPPGTRPDIERDTVRTQYAPLGVRRTRGLLVQPTVFPAPNPGLRVDAMLPVDPSDPVLPVRPRGIVVVMDTLGREVSRTTVEPRVRRDSATVLSVEQPLPPGSYVYRVEVRDDATGAAGLAQHRIDVPEPGGLMVSDLLVALPGAEPPSSRADPDLHGIPDLVLPPGQPVALYAEVSGLALEGRAASFAVQWWVERDEDGGLLRRAARWVGQRIGVVEAELPTRLEWEEGAPTDMERIFVTIHLEDAEAGLHRLGLRVRDRISGQERAVTRLIRVDPGARAPEPPGQS